MPLQIFCGTVKERKALEGILFQLLWLVVLTGVGKIAMQRAIRRVVVQGG